MKFGCDLGILACRYLCLSVVVSGFCPAVCWWQHSLSHWALWMNPWPVFGCALGSGIPLWPRGSGKPQHFAVGSSKDSARFLFLSVSIGSSLKIICNLRYRSAEFPSWARGASREAFLDQRPRRGARSKSQAKVQEHPSDAESSSTQKAAALLRL